MIAYFSCTGNSRAVALRLARRLGETAVDLSTLLRQPSPWLQIADGERLVFVFPVHSWGLPKGFAEFLQSLTVDGKPSYCAMVCTCGDDCGLAARQWADAMTELGIKTDAEFSVQMPNTYVLLPGFDVDKKNVEQRKLADMPAAVECIAQRIEARAEGDFTHHGAVAWLKTRLVYPWFMRHVDDRKFFATDACTGCGLCARVCPTKNIVVADRRPEWHGDCLNCLACYHNCPHHAVQFGRNSKNKGQYVCRIDLNSFKR